MRGFRRSSGRVAAWLVMFGTVAMDTQAVPAAPPRPPAAAPSPTDKAVSVVQTFMDRGQWSKAEGALHEVPDAGWQKVLRAQIHWKQGRVTEALKTLETFGGGSAKAERRQKLLLGEYRIGSGRRRDAEAPLLDIIADYNNDAITENDPEGLAVAGRAAHLLRSAKDANVLFNKSEQAGAPSVETLLWRGELFVEKYDPGHGEEVLKEALRLDAKKPDALAMLARLKLEQALDFDGAEKLADEALVVHPSHGPALAVKAGLALRDMELDRARGFLETGLKANPKDLELLSLKAATQFLADDKAGFAKAKADVLKVNPTYAQMYGIIGDLAEWEHRYDEVVAMMKEATRLDPDDARAWAQLGLTQLRSGAESEGLAALQTAWSKDKFNVRVYNTLNLYEKSIARDYETKDGTVFRIRFAKAEKPVLERYVPKLLGEAWVSMKSRYGFVPPLPVQVDLFTTREQFSVRTSGLPNIGIQGVCFGKVIAAMSPKGESFNWGNVLWHELGHVFAIAASKSHVPRWFTEGLSEYETLVRRPEWRRSLDARFYLALRKGRLPGAVDMNRAFTHASDGFDVTVAYYAASQMIVFTAEEFGMARILDALERWGQGEKTPAVLQKAFGVTPQQYDQRFSAWAKRKLARFDGQFLWEDDAKPLDKAEEEAKLHPKSADAQLDWAIALAQGRKMREAQQATDVALALDPKHLRSQFFAARLSASRQDWTDQRAHLEALLQAGGDGYQVRMALASSAEKLKDRQAQRRHWEAAHRFDATESEPLRGLYDLAKEDHRDQDALDILWRLAPLEQHDRQVWRLLLKGLVDANDWPRARDVGSAAMYVDVLSAESHALYGKALAALGDHETAAFEFESASLCDKPAKESARILALWARELLALGRVDEAKLRRDAALKEDPQCAEARSIDLP